jgi:acyl carrier protein
MIPPLRVSCHREAHAIATNAVLLSFFEKFGTLPRSNDQLWRLDSFQRLELVGDIELKLGVAFDDVDIEFVEHPNDLIARGASVLMRDRRSCVPAHAQSRQSMEARDGAQDHHR